MEQKTPVKSALRTLAVLEVFGRQMCALSLSEISRLLDIPPSSCYGLIKTLQDAGYLYSLDGRRKLYPTKRLLDLATVINLHDPVLQYLSPYLEQLRNHSGETVILGMRKGLSVVYLDVLEGTQTIRYSAITGETKPLHSSALGKAMLGGLPPEERRKMIRGLDLNAVTGNTITSASVLNDDIEKSQARGFYVTWGENVPDVAAIAKVVHCVGGVFGLVIAGPMHRMTDTIEAHAETLRDCCSRIEADHPIDSKG